MVDLFVVCFMIILFKMIECKYLNKNLLKFENHFYNYLHRKSIYINIGFKHESKFSFNLFFNLKHII